MGRTHKHMLLEPSPFPGPEAASRVGVHSGRSKRMRTNIYDCLDIKMTYLLCVGEMSNAIQST